MKKAKIEDSSNTIYCTYCGALNSKSKENKKCKKCGKKLKRRDFSLIEKIRDDTKDKYQGDFVKYITNTVVNGIKEHLYGIILTMSLSFTVVASIVNYVDAKDVPPINNEKYTFVGMTDAEKMVGCWHVVIANYETYQKVDKDLYVKTKVINNAVGTSNIGLNNGLQPTKLGIQQISFMPNYAYSTERYYFTDSDDYYNEETIPEEYQNNAILNDRNTFYNEDDEPVAGDVGSVGVMVWKDDNHFDVVSRNYYTENYYVSRTYTRISCSVYEDALNNNS